MTSSTTVFYFENCPNFLIFTMSDFFFGLKWSLHWCEWHKRLKKGPERKLGLLPGSSQHWSPVRVHEVRLLPASVIVSDNRKQDLITSYKQKSSCWRLLNVRSRDKEVWMKSDSTSSRGDSGGQTGTRWNSQWASPAKHSRCDFLRLAFQSSLEAPPPFVAQGFLVFCVLWEQNDHLDTKEAYVTAVMVGPAEMLTLLHLLLLLFDLIGYNRQLSLELCRRRVRPGKVVQRLPGVLKRADKTLL